MTVGIAFSQRMTSCSKQQRDGASQFTRALCGIAAHTLFGYHEDATFKRRLRLTQMAEQLKSQLAVLDIEDRAELAHFLITSLDAEEDTDADIEDAWEEEILRRHQEMESGAVETIPADEVFASIRAKLK